MSDIPNGKAIGKCFFVDRNNRYTLNQRICSIKAVNNNQMYLFYYLNRNKYYLSFDNGVSQTNLRKDEVLDCPVPLPPLPEQKKIAEILTTVDEKIGAVESQITAAEELKKGLMQKLFSEGIGHSEFQESSVGRIPKAWEVVELSTICAFITKGATPTTYGFDWVSKDEGIPFLRSECVGKEGFTESGLNFISEEAYNAMERSQIQPDDLLMTITGNIGRVVKLPIEFPKANINQHIARIRVTDEKMSNDFVYQQLCRPEYLEHYGKILTGQAYPQISLTQVRETPVMMPSFVEQEKIATILTTADEKITTLKETKSAYEELKKGLMQKLLTGEIRVRVGA